MKKILYAHPDESIAYLIDRMEQTEGDVMYIAADGNPALFLDAVNIKLLRREAANLGKRVVIVSLDQAVCNAARNANLETYQMSAAELEAEEAPAPPAMPPEGMRPEDSQEIKVRIIRQEAASGGTSFKPVEPAEPRVIFRRRDMMPREEIEEHRGGISFSWKFIVVSFVAAGAVAGAGFYALSPRLTLTIMPKKETLRFDFPATADSKISKVDVSKARIPGQLVQMEKEVTGEFPATGKQEGETKAQGEITLYNEFGSSSQTLVRNTRFETKDGKIFRLKEAMVIPGATVSGGKVTAPGVITAAVIADQPGALYNIGSSDFTIPGFAGGPKFTGFYGKSSKPMAGGGAGGGFAVTTEDSGQARSALAKALEGQLVEYINANVPRESTVLAGARVEGAQEFSADAPDANGKFRARLKASYEVFAFQESDVSALAEDHLSRRLLETQETVAGTRVVSYANEALNSAKTALSFTVKVNELAAGVINEEEIRAEVAGKGWSEVEGMLKENDAVESAEVTFWPRWISLAPDNPKRIRIVLTGVD